MTEATHTAGVDFHCHLDLYPDLEDAIAKAEAARIYTLTVTTTPKAWPRNYELTRHTRYVRAALGLHPQLIGVTAVHRSASETGTIKRISLVQPSCDSLAREMRVSAAWTRAARTRTSTPISDG